MADESVSAETVIPAPAEVVFAILADPAQHAAIDGTGWGNYEMANRVDVFDPPSAISWTPGYDADDGTLRFGGWTWRYDLVPLGPTQTAVTLTYDWSAVPASIREHIGFPPFPPDHLGNSLAHLSDLATVSARETRSARDR